MQQTIPKSSEAVPRRAMEKPIAPVERFWDKQFRRDTLRILEASRAHGESRGGLLICISSKCTLWKDKDKGGGLGLVLDIDLPMMLRQSNSLPPVVSEQVSSM